METSQGSFGRLVSDIARNRDNTAERVDEDDMTRKGDLRAVWRDPETDEGMCGKERCEIVQGEAVGEG